MKAYLLIICIGVSFSNPAIAFQNEPDGFRDIKWNTDIKANINELILVFENQELALYQRKNEKMSIGAAELEKIIYEYWNGKLVRIKISTSYDLNKINIIDAFNFQFGKGLIEKKTRRHIVLNWIGETTIVSIECKNKLQWGCEASLLSVKWIKGMRDKMEKDTTKAANDF